MSGHWRGQIFIFDKIQVSHKAPRAVGESGHSTLFTISLFQSKIKWCATDCWEKGGILKGEDGAFGQKLPGKGRAR